MPLVAIVGRPNVGKSTLFNRLTEARQAIVHDEPGVTRDRIYGHVEWNGRSFALVDTGGFVPRSAERFERAIREQVHIAIDEADIVLMVADVLSGVTDLDLEMARTLRRSQKPVLVVGNKADNIERRYMAAALYSLGLGEVFPVSSTNGMGTGDFLDALVALLPKEKEPEDVDTRGRIALIGRPNAGKSLIANVLLGQDRSIVTEVSGTTRDAVDSPISYEGHDLILVDTAGLRKRARVAGNIEFYSVLRTERAIERCDIAVLVLDAVHGLEAQDIRVLKEAEEQNKGLLIAVNKWDLIQKETNTARDYERDIKGRLQTLDHVPVIFISALTRQRVHRVLAHAVAILAERTKRIPTSALNEMLQQAVGRHHPPAFRSRHVQIKYVTQLSTETPVFAFFCNHPYGVSTNYTRYLERRLRESFGFAGVPISIVYRAKSKRSVPPHNA